MIRVSWTWDTGTETKGATKMQQAMLSIHQYGACIISLGTFLGANGLDNELPCFLLKYKLLCQASPAEQWHWFCTSAVGLDLQPIRCHNVTRLWFWAQSSYPVPVTGRCSCGCEWSQEASVAQYPFPHLRRLPGNNKAGKQSPGLEWWMLYFLESERRDKPVK